MFTIPWNCTINQGFEKTRINSFLSDARRCNRWRTSDRNRSEKVKKFISEFCDFEYKTKFSNRNWDMDYRKSLIQHATKKNECKMPQYPQGIYQAMHLALLYFNCEYQYRLPLGLLHKRKHIIKVDIFRWMRMDPTLFWRCLMFADQIKQMSQDSIRWLYSMHVCRRLFPLEGKFTGNYLGEDRAKFELVNRTLPSVQEWKNITPVIDIYESYEYTWPCSLCPMPRKLTKRPTEYAEVHKSFKLDYADSQSMEVIQRKFNVYIRANCDHDFRDKYFLHPYRDLDGRVKVMASNLVNFKWGKYRAENWVVRKFANSRVYLWNKQFNGYLCRTKLGELTINSRKECYFRIVCFGEEIQLISPIDHKRIILSYPKYDNDFGSVSKNLSLLYERTQCLSLSYGHSPVDKLCKSACF
ncbi:hypothetical protein ACOME3_004161 [Neoechinorhynchus agilis]